MILDEVMSLSERLIYWDLGFEYFLKLKICLKKVLDSK